MKWEIKDEFPIHAQLVEEINKRIINGVYPAGERIPSVRDLALEAKVNPNTMQKALQELETQNIIFTQRTSGKYVTQDGTLLKDLKKRMSQKRLKNFVKDMESLGFKKQDIMEMIGEEMKDDKV